MGSLVSGVRAQRALRLAIVAASIAGLGAVVGTSPASAHRRPPRVGCELGELQRVAPDATTLTSASASATADGVAYCRVDGFVTTTDPGPNLVNFQVSLPDRHNGRFYFQGLGGTAGYVPDPDPVLLAAGYATAGTDTGNQTGDTATQRAGLDWSFMGDPAIALDHDNRGGHVATVAAQAITKAYYGTQRLWRYHSGCSGGGRMGYSAAIMHPDDYDGIVIGAAGRDVGNILHFGKVGQFITRNIDLAVEPPPFAAFVGLGARVLADFDAADGAVDGMIWDPSVVQYSEAELDALLAQFGLTENWQEVVRLIIAGYDVGGSTFMPEYSLVGIENWTAWLPIPSIGFFFPVQVFGSFAAGTMPGVDWVNDEDFGPGTEADFTEELAGLQFGRPNSGELLNEFRDRGGKLLIWHGVNDPVISYNVAPVIYDEIVAEAGNINRARRWARLFPVPGLGHCGGGTGPQDTPYAALDALTRWVERGRAPSDLIATRPEGLVAPNQQALPARTFRLCSYPETPQFRGGLHNPRSLDVNDADNWKCQRPRGHLRTPHRGE